MSTPPALCFGDLFVGVNEAADANNLSDLEKKHIPFIEARERVRKGECFEVRVQVGKLLEHPNEYRHFIQFVELYADKTFLARVDLTAVRVCPKVVFCISLQHPVKELRAYGNCNLHGTWMDRKPIAVIDNMLPRQDVPVVQKQVGVEIPRRKESFHEPNSA